MKRPAVLSSSLRRLNSTLLTDRTLNVYTYVTTDLRGLVSTGKNNDNYLESLLRRVPFYVNCLYLRSTIMVFFVDPLTEMI